MLKLHKKRIDQGSSKFSVLLRCKFHSLSFSNVCIKGRLEGIDMDKFVNCAEMHSGCLFLVFLAGECAV